MLGFMINKSLETATDKKTKQQLRCLDLAMDRKMGLESAVDNFTAELLWGLNDGDDMIVFIQRAFLFLICGRPWLPRLTFASGRWQNLLLFQNNQRLTSMKDPALQTIAEAIAAFAMNYWIRHGNAVLISNLAMPSRSLHSLWSAPPESSKYKVTVTAASAQTGTYPDIETRVLRYLPVLPCRNSEGMRSLPNRLEILHSKSFWETELKCTPLLRCYCGHY